MFIICVGFSSVGKSNFGKNELLYSAILPFVPCLILIFKPIRITGCWSLANWRAYRRIIYQCNNKFRNKTGCSTPHLTEYEIKEYFIKALNRLITEKDEIIANTEMIQKMLCDNSELEAKRDALQEEIAVTVELTQNAVAENARVAQDQDDYNKHYNALVERYDRLKAQYDEVSTAISDNEARYEQMGRFITVLKDQEGVITEFDDALWSSLVEKIAVKSKEDVTVVFKDGTEMKAE